ncbi:MAG: hypothetical protein JRJ44_04970 [Deltaproteobacteria bacterium]|nr:hypothetical protein [Deltaproteobacteria bacterium]
METYKNSYTKNEDGLLWELHEIRHNLNKKRRNKSIDEINKEALKKYHNWEKEYNRKKEIDLRREEIRQGDTLSSETIWNQI